MKLRAFTAVCAIAALALPVRAQTTDPEPGVASGFTAGSPYSFRPLEPYWTYYALPPIKPRYARLEDSAVFMSSLNYPGIYGSYTYGVTPTSYYDAAPFINPAVATAATLRTGPLTGATLARNPTTALIDVLVPTSDAELTFDRTPTTPTGSRREFVTPPLAPRGMYMYDIRTRWTAEGTERSRSKRVYLQAGDRLVVDLTTVVGNYDGPSLRVQPPPETGTQLRTQPSLEVVPPPEPGATLRSRPPQP
jgi:uncharacterized protein (TIGR03000 family)